VAEKGPNSEAGDAAMREYESGEGEEEEEGVLVEEGEEEEGLVSGLDYGDARDGGAEPMAVEGPSITSVVRYGRNTAGGSSSMVEEEQREEVCKGSQ